VLTPAPEEEDEAAACSVSSEDFARDIRVLDAGEVRVMNLRDYVVGATSAEMPPNFPREALRAQAIAVRTLALRNIGEAERGAARHKGADICTSPACCMGFREPNDAAQCISDAAADTDGIIVTYSGEPILAVFFAASDGATRSSREV